MNGKQAIMQMFAAFGNTDVKRMAVYIDLLKDFPPAIVVVACKKAVIECKFLPTVAEIVASIKSLAGTAYEETRVKDWDEAEKEIVKAIRSYNYIEGDKTMYSTPEIAQVVESIGGIRDIALGDANEMPFALARAKKNYETICNRMTEQARNEYYLGKADASALIGKRKEELTQIKVTNLKALKEGS